MVMSIFGKFKKIERRECPHHWVACEFEDLLLGDVFRVVEPPQPNGLPSNPWVCLGTAEPVVGEPGNFGVQCRPEEFSVANTMPVTDEDLEEIREELDDL